MFLRAILGNPIEINAPWRIPCRSSSAKTQSTPSPVNLQIDLSSYISSTIDVKSYTIMMTKSLREARGMLREIKAEYVRFISQSLSITNSIKSGKIVWVRDPSIFQHTMHNIILSGHFLFCFEIVKRFSGSLYLAIFKMCVHIHLGGSKQKCNKSSLCVYSTH